MHLATNACQQTLRLLLRSCSVLWTTWTELHQRTLSGRTRTWHRASRSQEAELHRRDCLRTSAKIGARPSACCPTTVGAMLRNVRKQHCFCDVLFQSVQDTESHRSVQTTTSRVTSGIKHHAHPPPPQSTMVLTLTLKVFARQTRCLAPPYSTEAKEVPVAGSSARGTSSARSRWQPR